MSALRHIQWKRVGCGGFTLLELLVSMVILGIIVVICGQIFDQSTVAWDSGSRKAELNLTGRAVVDLVAQEISHAVDDGASLTQQPYYQYYATNLPQGASKIRFITLDGKPSSTARAVRWVEYDTLPQTYGSPSKTVPVLRRQSRLWPAAGSYKGATWAGAQSEAVVDVAENVTDIRFYPFFSGPGLPRYVDVEVRVARAEEIARGLSSNYVYRTRAYLQNVDRIRVQ